MQVRVWAAPPKGGSFMPRGVGGGGDGGGGRAARGHKRPRQRPHRSHLCLAVPWRPRLCMCFGSTPPCKDTSHWLGAPCKVTSSVLITPARSLFPNKVVSQAPALGREVLSGGSIEPLRPSPSPALSQLGGAPVLTPPSCHKHRVHKTGPPPSLGVHDGVHSEGVLGGPGLRLVQSGPSAPRLSGWNLLRAQPVP